MQLTHERARDLIQFEADSALSADSLRMLRAHLASCTACRTYADSIHATEHQLRSAMNLRWTLHPAHLNLEVIKAGSIHKTNQRNQLATRFATIAATVLLFVIGVLGVMNVTRTGNSHESSLDIPLIPTP